jgi:mRNA degradation ribonuclease J1/J2/DNA polymerase III epsilon subunit-like protein
MSDKIRRERFLSDFGLNDVWELLSQTGFATYATISTDLNDGIIRALLMRAKKTAQNEYRLRIKYLHHSQASENNVQDILELKFKESGEFFEITDARLDGRSIDIDNPKIRYAVAEAFREFSDHIIRRNEWINPVKVIDKARLPRPHIGRRAWPGLYLSGDFKTAQRAAQPSFIQEPVYPALFLPAIIGVGRENYGGKEKNTQRIAIHGTRGVQENSALEYSYAQGKTPQHMHVKGVVSLYGPSHEQEEVFYEVKTRPHKRHKKLSEITELRYMGQNIDLNNAVAVAAALKVIRNTNRMIRAGEYALLADLQKSPHARRHALPSDLALHTGLYEHLNARTPIPPEGIMSFTVVGGNNLKRQISDADIGIGDNQYIIGYEYLNAKKERAAEAVMIDAGVQFHDVFDVTFNNPAKYFRHKHDKSHVPALPVQAILFTHRHKDHLGQLAYLVKNCYELPVLVMNEMTILQFKRDLAELDIPKHIKDEILTHCYPINMIKDVHPENPLKRKKTTICGTTIEQWTETALDDTTGKLEHYPILKIGHMKIRVGPMPHSDPGMMFNVITPAGSHLHTGDYKIDNTIKVPMPPLDPWLRAGQPDTISADSTGATREGDNPTEADVGKTIKAELEAHPNNRFIFPMLGSNLARLTTTIVAMAEANTRHKTLIIDGRAVENLVRDADKVFGLKAWAKNAYGIDIIFRTEKKKALKFLNDRSRDDEYALLVTGTQDEPFSSINKAVRDLLPVGRYSITPNDRICFLQGVIPTGDNFLRRRNLKDFTELYHGATVILPEIVQQEAIWHSSGHNNRPQMKHIIVQSGKNGSFPVILPVHGGPAQLAEHVKLANEVGAHAILMEHDMSVRIQKGGKVTPYQIIVPELIGIVAKNSDPAKFYLKGRFEVAVIPIKPVLPFSASILVDHFEAAVLKAAGVHSLFEAANTLPVSLSTTFNAQTINRFLINNMPFGFDKYRGRTVFTEKNIGAVAGIDTETTELDARKGLIREFALQTGDLDRKKISETQIFQSIPDYRIPSLQAALVTGTDPETLAEGLPAHLFIRDMDAAIRSVKEHSHRIAQAIENAKAKKPGESVLKIRKNGVKAILLAHNLPFDSRFIWMENARNLITEARPHQTHGQIGLDTRALSRTLAAYCPSKYKVNIRAENGFADHTLGSLCKANGIQFDEQQAHGGAYDTGLCLKLFWHQYDTAPDLVSQMIVNADSSTGHLLNDITGMDTGFSGPHPVFSYVSSSAKRPNPQMGCLLGTMDTDRYAVIFNLKYDPNDYMHLSPDKLTDIIIDRDSDVIELIDLRNNPIIVPARYGLQVKANGPVPKEVLDRRAAIIKKNISYNDPRRNWLNITQKIESLWEQRRHDVQIALLTKYGDPLEPLNRFLTNGPTPDKSAGSLLKRPDNVFDQAIRKSIKLYVDALQSEKYADASLHYKEIISFGNRLGEARDTIINVHYDICKEDLSAADRARVESMRTYMLFLRYQSLKKEVHELETNTALWARFVGQSPEKIEIFKKTKQWLQDHRHLESLPASAQNLIHPWREITRSSAIQQYTLHNPSELAA